MLGVPSADNNTVDSCMDYLPLSEQPDNSISHLDILIVQPLSQCQLQHPKTGNQVTQESGYDKEINHGLVHPYVNTEELKNIIVHQAYQVNRRNVIVPVLMGKGRNGKAVQCIISSIRETKIVCGKKLF